ncbi:MAG: sulfotransferase domain-containing protein [Terriglobales bacterium]
MVTAARLLTGRQVAGRSATIFPDDVYLVSYPRSGNTWTRFLIANLLDPEHPATFGNIESRVPEIYFNYDRVLRRLPRPRLLKSHEPFNPRYPKMICIVRDPRDVAVSFYHHNVKWRNIPDDYPIDDFIPGFIAGQYDAWSGSWADNVKSWISMRQGGNNFLLLRYEDLRHNTLSELLRVAEFLRLAGFSGIATSPDKLALAIERSSPERMRELEREQTRQHVQLKRTRQDKPFIRTATSGGWRSALSETSVALIEGAWAELMENLGYPLSRALQEADINQSSRA